VIFVFSTKKRSYNTIFTTVLAVHHLSDSRFKSFQLKLKRCAGHFYDLFVTEPHLRSAL